MTPVESETPGEPGAPAVETEPAGARSGLLVLRLLALGPLAVAGVLYLADPDLRATLDRGVALLVKGDVSGLRDWGESLGAWAAVATSLLMVVQAIAAPIPAVLVTATNSLLFGPLAGGVLSIVSATVAAAICYLIARVSGEPLVKRLVPARSLARADAFIERHGATAVLVARLIPWVPFDPISFIAGLCRMRLWPFFWATLIGQIPAGMTYSYLAQEIGDPSRLLVRGVAALATLLLLGCAAHRILSRRRERHAASPPS